MKYFEKIGMWPFKPKVAVTDTYNKGMDVVNKNIETINKKLESISISKYNKSSQELSDDEWSDIMESLHTFYMQEPIKQYLVKKLKTDKFHIKGKYWMPVTSEEEKPTPVTRLNMWKAMQDQYGLY